MTITNTKYVNSIDTNQRIAISANINGVTQFVPIDNENTDYAEIMRQVAAGTLTIAAADAVD